MAIVVEDGTGTNPAANSYGDTEGLIAYALARGIVISEATAEKHLIVGMDWFEAQPFPGTKTSETQPLQFPREDFYIDGYLIADDEIPNLVVECEYEAAIADAQGNSQIATQSRVVKRVQVGTISKEYADNSPSRAIPTALYNKFQRLMGSGFNNGFEFRVSEG